MTPVKVSSDMLRLKPCHQQEIYKQQVHETDTNLNDHLASRFSPFSLTRFLLPLLKHTFPGRAVLEGKHCDELAEGVHPNVLSCEARIAKEQQELVKPKTRVNGWYKDVH